jgi:hypothetical protein
VQELLGHLPYGKVPDLVELTYAAYDVIKKTTRETAAAAINPKTCEYVIIAGVQIHGPDGKNFFWPGEITKFADGKETDLVSFLCAARGSRRSLSPTHGCLTSNTNQFSHQLWGFGES